MGPAFLHNGKCNRWRYFWQGFKLLLHDEGPMNTHELAKRLSRDYKNVRLDVLALNEVGGRLLSAPWRKITMELRMAA